MNIDKINTHRKEEKLQVEVLSEVNEVDEIHQDIELLFVLEGELDVVSGSQHTVMKSEDILLINANKKHSIKGSDDVLFARLFITYQLVSDVCESTYLLFWCDSTRGNNERYDELRDTLKQLLNHYLSTKRNSVDFGHIALCYRVMDLLSVHFLVRADDEEQMDAENRILQINNYVRANYNRSISLAELADQLYLSESYLSRFFKKNYGTNFSAYVTKIRLYYALSDLLYTEHPITRIAFDNGFSNATVFNKAFKAAYGETPSEFRKKTNENKANNKLSETEKAVNDRLEEFLRNDGIQQEERKAKEETRSVFSAKSNVKVNTFWNDMINVGSAEDLLKSEIREHVIILKESLNFKYVRFWSPFSKQLLIDVHSETGVYNFSRLDSIFDFLLEIGLKPHVEIGMKPKRLHEGVDKPLIFERIDDSYPGEEKWKAFLTAWISHLLHRYGRAEISDWRIELWFRERSHYTVEDIEDYFDLFDMTCETIHSLCDEIKIGGNGFRFDQFIVLQDLKFIERWAKRKYFPDFITGLYFAYERGVYEDDKFAKRITDNEGVLNAITKFKELIPESKKDIPFYLSEWNLTVSDRNYINDTCFKGAYIVKNLIDIYGLCDSAALFQGSDRFSDYYDSAEMLYGGTGVLTKDGIFKPAAFAFEFFNRLHSYFLCKNSNCLATTDGHDSYGIICHNQKKLNYNYYFSSENEIDKANIWKYFEDRDSRDIKLTLTDVKDGIYQMKTYSINEQNGGVLDIWGELNYENDLTRNDIKYFQRACSPKLKIQKIEVKDGKLDVDVTLSANEIAFVRLKWFGENKN